mmetsp:Transcript_16392/g.45350  ORF Transcript_16392/g.45350 Transcript_16392/m.45350 type:complete len:264 (+) Transcript_16392:1572-2363(+)
MHCWYIFVVRLWLLLLLLLRLLRLLWLLRLLLVLLMELCQVLRAQRWPRRRTSQPLMVQDLGGAQAFRRLLTDGLPEDVPQPARQSVPRCSMEVQAALHCSSHRCGGVPVRAAEWHFLAKQEIQHHASTEHIHLVVVRCAQANLGRHVARGAAAPSHLRLIVDERGQAEVRDDGAVRALQQDIFSLYVTVHDVFGVDVLQRAHHTLEKRPRVPLQHRAAPQDLVQEVPANGHFEGHDHPRLARDFIPEHTAIADDVVVGLHVD